MADDDEKSPSIAHINKLTDIALDNETLDVTLKAEFDKDYLYNTADLDALALEVDLAAARRRVRFEQVRAEYASLWAEMAIRQERMPVVQNISHRIYSERARYRAVEQVTRVPWYVVGIIHSLEAGLRFDRHLHNGDPLSSRTTRVPAGRPRSGSPPFAWEESAIDALTYDGLTNQSDWSLERTAYRLEGFNGWGYRLYHPHVKTPYLWSFSNHYTRGKYVGDGKWSDTAVSQQCGGMTVLRYLVDTGAVRLSLSPLEATSKQEIDVLADVYDESQIDDVEEYDDVADLETDDEAEAFDDLSSQLSSSDRSRIPELILQGSTREGLARARRAAASRLREYPHNGCAIHLSALMRHAGINVTWEADAGDLVTRIKRRGWSRVGVGNQRPGDIGVTYDYMKGNPGADHIYLVVGIVDRDVMQIADNQRMADRPHPRAASGRNVGQGRKTATEYFLRA